MGKTLQKYLFAGTIIILGSCIVMAKVSHIQKEKCKLGDSISLLSVKTDVGLRKIIGDYMNRYKKYDSYIVTEKTKTNLKLKEEYKDKINFLVYGTNLKSSIY